MRRHPHVDISLMLELDLHNQNRDYAADPLDLKGLIAEKSQPLEQKKFGRQRASSNNFF